MRVLPAIAISMLVLGLPVQARSMSPQSPPAVEPPLPGYPSTQGPPDQGLFDLDESFTRVAVIAMDDLPSDLRTQAEAIVAQTSADDLRALQNSIDGSLQATAALAANGLNSSQVVAANVDGDGTLTLIIQATT